MQFDRNQFLTDQQLREAIAAYNGDPFAGAYGMRAPASMGPSAGPPGAVLPPEQSVPPAAMLPPEQSVPPAAAVPPPQAAAAAPATPAARVDRRDPYAAAMQAVEQQSAIRADAQRGAAEARERAGQAEADAVGRLRDEIGESSARQQARAKDFREYRDRQLAEYSKLSEEAARMSARDRRTRGQKAMGALAVGIGNIADGLHSAGATYAGVSSSSNYAQQIDDAVNTAVERDLEEQREAIRNAKDRAANALVELGLARDFFQDDATADAWAAQALREQYGLELQQQAATLNSEVARQEGIAVGAQITQDAAERKLGIYERHEELKLRRRQVGNQTAKVGIDWGKLTRGQLEALAEQGTLPADGQVVLDRVREPELRIAREERDRAQHDRDRMDAEERDSRKRLDRVGDDMSKITAARIAVRDLLPYEAGAKDLPSTATGFTGLLTPERLVSTEGRQFKGKLASAQNAFLRIATGAGATEKEAERQWAEFGLRENLNQSAQSIVEGLGALATRVREYEQVIRAKDPEGFELFERNRLGADAGPGGGVPASSGGSDAMGRLKSSFGFRPSGGR